KGSRDPLPSPSRAVRPRRYALPCIMAPFLHVTEASPRCGVPANSQQTRTEGLAIPILAASKVETEPRNSADKRSLYQPSLAGSIRIGAPNLLKRRTDIQCNTVLIACQAVIRA